MVGLASADFLRQETRHSHWGGAFSFDTPARETSCFTDSVTLAGSVCEQQDCTAEAETYCPLCERLLCRTHDELVAYRGHDCLSGPADAD
jgi:hypothetical protein